MNEHHDHSISFLLRLWRVHSIRSKTWHASLENPMTGERTGFADLDALISFLKTVTSGGQPDEQETILTDNT